jgi:hypothetical protein
LPLPLLQELKAKNAVLVYGTISSSRVVDRSLNFLTAFTMAGNLVSKVNPFRDKTCGLTVSSITAIARYPVQLRLESIQDYRTELLRYSPSSVV